MMGHPGTLYKTADAVLCNINQPVRVYVVHEIYGASSTGSVLRNGASTSGTIYASLKSTDSQGVTHNLGDKGMLFPNGCFFDIGANVTSATIVCEAEL